MADLMTVHVAGATPDIEKVGWESEDEPSMGRSERLFIYTVYCQKT
jgi:hypothetical protein